MQTVPVPLPPIVRAAVTALDAFGALSRREAHTLLGYWARRDQLTDTDVGLVLEHYPVGSRHTTPGQGVQR